jgi:hypothetical protein
MEATKIVRLKRPIEQRSKTTGAVVHVIDELTLRPPTAGDMADALDAADGDNKRQGTIMSFLAARCAGVSFAQFKDLTWHDGAAILAEVSDFLADGPEIGPTWSPSSSGPSASSTDGANGRPTMSGSSPAARADTSN